MKRLDRAEVIQKVMEMRNACDAIIDILVPGDSEEGCPHPAEKIQDLSTLDDDGELYRCTACGTESKTPFPSIQPED